MATNLVEIAKNQLTPDIIQRAGAIVGESPASTRRAMDLATPALFTGITEAASSTAGAERLKQMLDEAGLAGSGESFADRLGASGEGIDSLIGWGKGILSRVFGARLGSVVDATANAAGVKRSAMSSLLGLALPLVLGVIGRETATRGLDASGIAAMLRDQKASFSHALPPGVAEVVHAGTLTGVASPVEDVRVVPVAERQRPGIERWWPALLLIPLIVLGLLLGRRREAPAPAVVTEQAARPVEPPRVVEPPRAVEPLPAPVPVPPPAAVAAPAGPEVAREMAIFLASPTGEVPKRFVFEDMNFDFATTHLTPPSVATLDDVAADLKAHPTAEVVVEGHTDAIGAPAANKSLSDQRARAVKSALVARGVAADHVSTQGFGQERPVASNDSPEGRAKNRRTEIVIIKR